MRLRGEYHADHQAVPEPAGQAWCRPEGDPGDDHGDPDESRDHPDHRPGRPQGDQHPEQRHYDQFRAGPQAVHRTAARDVPQQVGLGTAHPPGRASPGEPAAASGQTPGAFGVRQRSRGHDNRFPRRYGTRARGAVDTGVTGTGVAGTGGSLGTSTVKTVVVDTDSTVDTDGPVIRTDSAVRECGARGNPCRTRAGQQRGHAARRAAGERSVMDEPSGVQDEHPLGEAGHAVEVVGNHHQRQAGPDPKAHQNVDQDPPGRGVQARQRFVENHQPGSVGDQPGERGPAHLPTGEILHPPVPEELRVEPDRGESLVGGSRVHTGRRAHVSTHGGRQQLQAGVLHGESDLAGAGGQRPAGEARFALRRTQQTGEDGCQCRLARSVATADQHGLAAVETEGDTAQCPAGPRRPGRVDLPHTVEADQRGCARGPPLPGGCDRGDRCGGPDRQDGCDRSRIHRTHLVAYRCGGCGGRGGYGGRDGCAGR